MSNLLESDSSILEKNLKFVKNEFEEEFQQIFGAPPDNSKPVESKIVKPIPGLCIKCFKLNTNEKFFINLCQTDGIPPPEDISENDLADILKSETPSSYRIPMSISEPRSTTDKSGNQADVCDIAVNPKFFQKCEKVILFRDFLVAITLEGLSDKYNIQLRADNWIILKNRKFMGTLVTHRVQNRDVKTVYESYQNPSKEEKKIVEEFSAVSRSGKKLIQEINAGDAIAVKKKSETLAVENISTSKQIKADISMANSNIPEHRIVGKIKESQIDELLAEFYLPNCISSSEITLDVGEDRILLESMKRGYLFDKFLEYQVDQDRVSANFNAITKMLQVSIPLMSARKI